MQENLPTNIDPYELTARGQFIVFKFLKSNTKNWDFILDCAKDAKHFQEVPVGKRSYFLAAFGIDRLQFERARALHRYIVTLTGSQVIANGREVGVYDFGMVADCYAGSLRAKTRESYCHVIQDIAPVKTKWLMIDGISKPTVEVQEILESKASRFVISCRYLTKKSLPKIGPKMDLPEYVQAQAAYYKCEWCPNFNPNESQLIGIDL